MIDIESGDPAVDRYLSESYERVRGMSSRFAAAICGYLMCRQTSLGVTGDVVEIGTFEGRFFIAMALGLAPAERAIGIDRFDWPDAKIEARFLANCAAHGVMAERFVSWKADSREITPAMLRERLGGRAVRFAHIDSHHARECLTNDLELIHAVMHPDGIICLDDMLHPAYPMLTAAAFDYLARHAEMRLLVRHRPRGHRRRAEIPDLPRGPARALRARPDGGLLALPLPAQCRHGELLRARAHPVAAARRGVTSAVLAACGDGDGDARHSTKRRPT